LRGDMIEVFKIVNDIYDEKVAPRPTLRFNQTSVTIEATNLNCVTKYLFTISENIFSQHVL